MPPVRVGVNSLTAARVPGTVTEPQTSGLGTQPSLPPIYKSLWLWFSTGDSIKVTGQMFKSCTRLSPTYCDILARVEPGRNSCLHLPGDPDEPLGENLGYSTWRVVCPEGSFEHCQEG